MDNEPAKKQRKDMRPTNLSDIPEVLLAHIISFISTREAVRTSVLSKSWENIWKAVSKLDLEQGAESQTLKDFINRLIKKGYDWSRIEKFSLCCTVGDHADLVKKCLSLLNSSRIKELNLKLLGAIREPMELPVHIFQSATLTKFQLHMQHILYLPASIRYEVLKTLTLERVIFPNDFLTNQLFSSLPSLKELSLLKCNWVYVLEALSISIPSLQKLTITDSREVEDGTLLKIDGRALKCFSYDGVCIISVLKNEATSVINASIVVRRPKMLGWTPQLRAGAANKMSELLAKLPFVEKLSISNLSLTVINLRRFRNLCLSSLTELHVVSVIDMPVCCAALLEILLPQMPCLQAITFKGRTSLPKHYRLHPLPSCFQTTLKKIEIDCNTGIDEDIVLIKFLLATASVLERLDICYISDFCPHSKSKRLRRLKKRISSFPKVSSRCEIAYRKL